MPEPQLKKRFRQRMESDFHIYPDVRGRHLSENQEVVIDFLIKPKPHLLAAEFKDGWVGVEVKYLKEYKLGALSKLAWQSLSYGQSEFEIEGGLYRPMFVLMHANVSFNLQHQSGIPEQLTGLLAFLEYGNVGWVEFDPKYDWRMGFGSHGYFNKKYGKNKVKNVGTKRNVGNLS